MESRALDDVKFEKREAMARFNRFRMIFKVWKLFQVLVGFGVISWSSAHARVVLKTAAGYFVTLSAHLLNHHVVFLLGNAIIVTLFLLCRQNDDFNTSSGCGDLYDDYDYVKFSDAIHHREPTLTLAPPLDEDADGGCDQKKQTAVRTEETNAIAQCDDVAAAIEKATKLISRFQRIQSEKLRPELLKSGTVNRRKTVSSWSASEIENLNSEEFRRKVDDFITKHWSSKAAARDHFTGEKYKLLNIK